MTQKKKGAIKTNVGTEQKEIEKVVASPKPNPTVSTLEEATALVEESYKKPLVLDYVVLSNKTVFYGINRNAALKAAKIFGLKYFDVKLEE
jgi:hypothetical protein